MNTTRLLVIQAGLLSGLYLIEWLSRIGEETKGIKVTAACWAPLDDAVDLCLREAQG